MERRGFFGAILGGFVAAVVPKAKGTGGPGVLPPEKLRLAYHGTMYPIRDQHIRVSRGGIRGLVDENTDDMVLFWPQRTSYPKLRSS